MKHILAIETSCDETSVAVIDMDGNVIKERTFSQIEIHKQYGGVVPEVASRSHVVQIQFLLKEISNDFDKTSLVAVAATGGPGLIGGLMVGVMVAKGISFAMGIPFIAVNHLEGHLLSPKIERKDFSYPFVSALMSGGHCQVVLAREFGNYEIIGKTVDDSVGEAFDKIARVLGFDYPGGKYIEQCAKAGDKDKYKFTVPMNETGNCNMSFSGLKTAAINVIKGIGELSEQDKADVSASLQNIIVKTLLIKLNNSITYAKSVMPEVKNLSICGGVASNLEIRSAINDLCQKHGMNMFIPSLRYCTDNASMIAVVALEYYKRELYTEDDFEPVSRWPVDNIKIN